MIFIDYNYDYKGWHPKAKIYGHILIVWDGIKELSVWTPGK